MNDTGSLFSTLSKKTAQVPTSFECFSLQGPSSQRPLGMYLLRRAQHCPHRTEAWSFRVSPSPWQALVLSPRGVGQGFEVKRVTSPPPPTSTPHFRDWKTVASEFSDRLEVLTGHQADLEPGFFLSTGDGRCFTGQFP